MSELPESLRSLLADWAKLWEVSGLEAELEVSFSPRLKRSLGRCRPAAARITLKAELRGGPPERLAEVLCHEAAHVAVYRKYGPVARAHGAEWQALVRAAGYEPRIRAQAPTGEAGAAPTGRLEYEHRCPVCHTVRYARRPVTRWRCAECLDAGLDGEMIITRRAEA